LLAIHVLLLPNYAGTSPDVFLVPDTMAFVARDGETHRAGLTLAPPAIGKD
jgi:hypothetical protein